MVRLERGSFLFFFFFHIKCETSLFYLGGSHGGPLEVAVHFKSLGIFFLSFPSESPSMANLKHAQTVSHCLLRDWALKSWSILIAVNWAAFECPWGLGKQTLWLLFVFPGIHSIKKQGLPSKASISFVAPDCK